MKVKIFALIVFFWTICYRIDEVKCKKLKCRCLNRCPEYHVNNTCETDGNCFSQVVLDETTGDLEKYLGCLPEEPSDDVSIFQCKKGERELEERNSVVCCSGPDFCNENLKPTLKPTKPTSPSPAKDVDYTIIALAVSSAICIAVLLVIILWLCCRHNNSDAYRQIKVKGRHIVSNSQTLQQLLQDTAASEFGLPKLVQRTIARQVHLTRKIGTGHFSRVYEAQWRGDKVAVRVFQSRDEVVWIKEYTFYDDLARHNNILAFIASDRVGGPSATELYLITEYCPHGSLHEYLRTHFLSKRDMLRLVTSVACGLAYLHIEVTGTHRKCAIAHRNLTSKGIYVKRGGVCVLGDFALAVKADSEISMKEMEKNPKQATKLYMAPEVLDKTLIPWENHSGLLKADIYSLGLVLWEIAFRSVSEGICEPYQMPYQGMVTANPSIDELRKVVCIERKRPPILNRWHDDKVMRSTSNVIEECWHPSPNARLTALRVQKSLMTIQESLTSDETQVV